MKILLTGSQVYSIPRENSDIDLVLLSETCEDENIIYLLQNLCNEHDETDKKYQRSVLRFGQLNLIVYDNKPSFDAWQAGTELLKEFAPVTRDQAVFVIGGFLSNSLTFNQARAYLVPKLL